MKINIGDLLMFGCNNGHPTNAGIVTSITTVGNSPDGELKDEDCVYLNEEENPWQVWEIKDKLFAHVDVTELAHNNIVNQPNTTHE